MLLLNYCENEAILLGEMKKLQSLSVHHASKTDVQEHARPLSHDAWSLHCSSNTARACCACMPACTGLVIRIGDRCARTYDVFELQTPTARVVHSGAKKRI